MGAMLRSAAAAFGPARRAADARMKKFRPTGAARFILGWTMGTVAIEHAAAAAFGYGYVARGLETAAALSLAQAEALFACLPLALVMASRSVHDGGMGARLRLLPLAPRERLATAIAARVATSAAVFLAAAILPVMACLPAAAVSPVAFAAMAPWYAAVAASLGIAGGGLAALVRSAVRRLSGRPPRGRVSSAGRDAASALFMLALATANPQPVTDASGRVGVMVAGTLRLDASELAAAIPGPGTRPWAALASLVAAMVLAVLATATARLVERREREAWESGQRVSRLSRASWQDGLAEWFIRPGTRRNAGRAKPSWMAMLDAVDRGGGHGTRLALAWAAAIGIAVSGAPPEFALTAAACVLAWNVLPRVASLASENELNERLGLLPYGAGRLDAAFATAALVRAAGLALPFALAALSLR